MADIRNPAGPTLASEIERMQRADAAPRWPSKFHVGDIVGSVDPARLTPPLRITHHDSASYSFVYENGHDRTPYHLPKEYVDERYALVYCRHGVPKGEGCYACAAEASADLNAAKVAKLQAELARTESALHVTRNAFGAALRQITYAQDKGYTDTLRDALQRWARWLENAS